MQLYTPSLTEYLRLPTLEVKVGDILLGNFNPIRVQTMTTTDTMDTEATVAQAIRCIEAGSELVRITAPSRNEAENLLNIKKELYKRGYKIPLVADIHFTPNAAEIAARIVEKVRINPGNYVDKKKFEQIDYTDAEYLEEIDRIRERFTPLVRICKEYGTAMRIGTNHGSLSDRIMSRYGDTAIGMVESALEFLRIAESEGYYNIVLSMKSSNPQVMVHAYRLLVNHMMTELGHCYPLHLGVTEAGDGEDGRIKSAIGIGTLLEDGIGDTIRVSLTEDPEIEIPVCKNIIKRYEQGAKVNGNNYNIPVTDGKLLSPFAYVRRVSDEISNVGSKHAPVIVGDLRYIETLKEEDLTLIGYTYNAQPDKWSIGDQACDFILYDAPITFPLPGSLKVISTYTHWLPNKENVQYFPIFDGAAYQQMDICRSTILNFVMVDCYPADQSPNNDDALLDKICKDNTAVVCLTTTRKNSVQAIRRKFIELREKLIDNPVIILSQNHNKDVDQMLIDYAIDTGALLLDGFGDGICLYNTDSFPNISLNSRLINSISFGILQATRTRISKTEYISCPSCGRTLFDLQETTAKIRAVTNHLKGVKIAIMGCIVNGPGEMADADFGYVGSGPGKITLYRGKEVIKRSVDEKVAVDELVSLLKENNAWVERP